MIFSYISAIVKKYIVNYDELLDFKLGPYDATYFVIFGLSLLLLMPIFQIFKLNLHQYIIKLAPYFGALTVFLLEFPILSKFQFTFNYDLISTLSKYYVMVSFITDSCYCFVRLLNDRERRYKKLVANIFLALNLFEFFIRFFELYYFFRGTHKWKSLVINSIFHGVYFFGRLIYYVIYQKSRYSKLNDNKNIENPKPSNAIIRNQTYGGLNLFFYILFIKVLESCSGEELLDDKGQDIVQNLIYIQAMSGRIMLWHMIPKSNTK